MNVILTPNIYTPPSALGSSLHQGEKQYKNHSDPPLRELNLCEITEDADHLDVLHVPQLQNQEWNCSNQQYKDPYTDFKGKPEEAPPDRLLTPLQFSNSWFLTIRFQILVYLTQCRKIPSPFSLLFHIQGSRCRLKDDFYQCQVLCTILV